MTIASSQAKAGPFVADGRTSVYPFPFRVLSPSHVTVEHDGEIPSYDIQVLEDSGNVVFHEPVPDGTTLTILRNVPLTQETDLQNNTAFLPEVLEDSLDKLTMICQQLAEELERCIKSSATDEQGAEALLESIRGAVSTAVSASHKASASASNATSAAADAADSANAAASELSRLQRITGRDVFEVFYSLSSEVPAGAMDLSLGTVILDCDKVFPEFWSEAVKRKAAGTIPVLTEDEWQLELSEHGSCGAFVVDESAKSVRLPKITHILQPGNAGEFTPEGLPNITAGMWNLGGRFESDYTGALSVDYLTSEYSSSSGTGIAGGRIDFDASKSNGIYGSSDHVQPATIGAKLYIQVYGAAIPASTVQAAELIRQLAGYLQTGGGTMHGNVVFDKPFGVGFAGTSNVLKANGDRLVWGDIDITELTETKVGFPNYAAQVYVGNINTYTATQDGWIFAVKRVDASYWMIKINGERVFSSGGSSYDVGSCFLPVKKGDVVKSYNNWEGDPAAMVAYMHFYPNR